jgi:hypothetical protein
MSFLSKILTNVLNALLTKLVSWGVEYWKKQERLKEEKAKNKEAINKLKDSKTKEEIDEALDDILDNTFD